MSPVRPSDYRHRKYPTVKLSVATRPLRPLPRCHRYSVSTGGSPECRLGWPGRAWKFGFGWPAAAALLFTWVLLAASAIDFRCQLLPDDLILPLLWFGLAVALFSLFADLRSAVIGAMAGYLSLWSVYQAFRLLTGKEGMGYGDFKLLAALGAWAGWQHLVTIVILSSLVGAVFGIVLILLRGRDRQAPMPFGPFLAAAGWITLLWGDKINSVYLQWLGF
jgi:leader peptidase (prepilin peptidase)/N-methyltransferase